MYVCYVYLIKINQSINQSIICLRAALVASARADTSSTITSVKPKGNPAHYFRSDDVINQLFANYSSQGALKKRSQRGESTEVGNGERV